MPFLMIRHRVADFSKWRPSFDDHRKAREAAGLEDVHLWRRSDDPDEVVVLFRADDVERARAFSQSEDLKTAMRDAGVQGTPEVLFLEEQELRPARPAPTRREPRAPGP